MKKIIHVTIILIFSLTFVLSGYTFKIKDKNYKDVAILGDFNNWNPSKHTLSKQNNNWTITIPLTKGTYKYQFLVDGTFISDPQNRNKEIDAITNSTLSIISIQKGSSATHKEQAMSQRTNKIYRVPLKLTYGNYRKTISKLNVVCEHKTNNNKYTEKALLNYLDNSFITMVDLPEGMYNYYFLDENGNTFSNSDKPLIEDNNISKNTLIVNGRFFSVDDNLKNYIADEFIILTDKNTFEICTLKNDIESMKVLLKVLDITFEYPLIKQGSKGNYDIYYLKEDVSNIKPFDYAFVIKDGIYTMYLDREGLKPDNKDLIFLHY